MKKRAAVCQLPLNGSGCEELQHGEDEVLLTARNETLVLKPLDWQQVGERTGHKKIVSDTVVLLT